MVIVASTAAIVAASVIAAGLGAGALWVFEVLAATGVLVGLGVAFGALDRDPGARRTARRGRGGEPQLHPELTPEVTARLDELDPVEHRRLDLGAPWPSVVVGPTGVSVVAVADRVAAPAVAGLAEVVAQVRDVVRDLDPGHDRAVEVRGLLVVPPSEAVPSSSLYVRSVSVDELAGAIARGPLVSMSTAAVLFARLSGVLTPSLRPHAV